MPRDHGPDAQGEITAILGPTNTGKTHYAIERMLSRADGVIGLPLRLLAREVYDRIVKLRGPGAAALITGEEKIAPATAKYWVCTVEAMPTDGTADFVCVDEIQLCADPERGHVFTDRLLRARGRYETLFLGAETVRPRIQSLVPRTRFIHRERFSELTYTGSRKISRLKPRTAVVAFSVDQVYAIAELIRRQRGGAAVVMGALSPRTRNAQVTLYQNGDVDYLVATDAIGMGLNLDVDHVAFAGMSKFDGRRHRHLAPNELAQIAGRAGRYRQNGSFGVTGEAGPMEPEVVEAIENHRFRPVAKLMWRNAELRFGSVPALIASLEAAPDRTDLARAREADDLASLKLLWEQPDIATLAIGGERVRLLWDVCQIPDFRNTVSADHVMLLARIYRFLLEGSQVIPSDWIAGQVRRLDRTDGDIDALSKRLAYIRTWTYVANRARWVENPEHWRDATREVEDRLSDALHQRLTQRFVDRRTSLLMRRLKQKERLVADVNDKGEVSVEGEFVGRLDGFRFTPDQEATAEEVRTLRSASLAGLKGELSRRADKLYLSPDTEIDLTEQGGLMWGQDAIGRLEKGDDPLAPKVKVFVDDLAEPQVAEKVERRLAHWLARRIAALFEPMIKMREDEAVTGLARGVAFQLAQAMGVMNRRQIADDVKQLGQDERALLRKHGVRFGQHSIFMPALLKPAPTRMRLILWSLWEGLDEFPSAPPAGHVTFPAVQGMPQGYYEKAGYRLCGSRAVRIDMLERLADLLRPMDAKAGFEATPDMLSITGATLDQLADMLSGLGYQAERGERPKPPRPVAREAGTGTEEQPGKAGTLDVPDPAGEGLVGQRPGAEPSSLAREKALRSGAVPGGEAVAGSLPAGPAESERADLPEGPPDPSPGMAEDATPSPDAAGSARTTDGAAAETSAPEAAMGETGEADAPDLPEGTDEVEVFYTFTLRPRQGRRGGDANRRGKPGGRRPPKSAKDSKPPRGAKPSARPKREEKPVDPDSPFAILQQLKEK